MGWDLKNVDLFSAQTITGVKSFSALVVHSAGNETSGYSGTFTPQWIDVLGGTLAAGDTVAQPSVKVSRYLNLQGSQIPVGIGLDEGSLIYGSVTVPTTGQVPGTAVFGLAKTQSTSSGATGGGGQSISADAQGVVGVGQALSGSTRVGIGGYFEGNAQAAGGLLSGVQIGARNSTGADATAPAAAFSQSQALWLTSLGTNQAAEAIAIGNPSGRQFDVGLHANGQASGGFTGGIATAFIQDDSTAATSILIKGTHSTGAVAVAAGAGSVVLGGTTFSFTPALLEVRGISGTSYTPLAVFSGSGVADDISVRVRNGSGSSDYFASGATNHLISGSAAGDTGIVINTSGKHWLIGPSTGAALVVGQDGIVGINNGIAMGGGAAPTLGTIGGSGPATAGQNSWLKVNIAGVASYIPIWR